MFPIPTPTHLRSCCMHENERTHSQFTATYRIAVPIGFELGCTAVPTPVRCKDHGLRSWSLWCAVGSWISCYVEGYSADLLHLLYPFAEPPGFTTAVAVWASLFVIYHRCGQVRSGSQRPDRGGVCVCLCGTRVQRICHCTHTSQRTSHTPASVIAIVDFPR